MAVLVDWASTHTNVCTYFVWLHYAFAAQLEPVGNRVEWSLVHPSSVVDNLHGRGWRWEYAYLARLYNHVWVSFWFFENIIDCMVCHLKSCLSIIQASLDWNSTVNEFPFEHLSCIRCILWPSGIIRKFLITWTWIQHSQPIGYHGWNQMQRLNETNH